MKKDNIKKALDSIQLDKKREEKMLKNILMHKNPDEKQSRFTRYKVFPILITLFLGISAIYMYQHFNNDNLTITQQGNHNNGYQEEVYEENGAARIRDEFQIDDKYYVLLSDDKREDYNLPAEMKEEDIGDHLNTITESVDENLIDKNVYQYLPAENNAVVVVKDEDNYQLYEFYYFMSYEENKDEDAVAYLKLYGIESESDISKIEFGHYKNEATNQSFEPLSKIDEPEDLKEFYHYYAQLTDDSEKYFNVLFEEDEESTENEKQNDPSENEGNEQSSPSYEGTAGNKLESSIVLRIYPQSGIFYETIYYPNIQFISRHFIKDDFLEFLEPFLNETEAY